MTNDDDGITPTPNLDAMPHRREWQKMINEVARGDDVADLTFMLQAMCLELFDLRKRVEETTSVLARCKIGYSEANIHESVNYVMEEWGDDLKSRRPAA